MNPELNELMLAYIRRASRAGCCPAQIINFCRAGVFFQERQLAASAAARQCDVPGGPVAVGFGGARGGGKSHWLMGQIGADDCQRRPGLKCLVLRKVGKANIENIEDLRLRLFRGLPHVMNHQKAILTFSNGSTIHTGHFQAEKDTEIYLGLEYDLIGVEEATTLTERKFSDIKTCLRTSKKDWRPRMYSTTNPGGVGHDWYKREFIDPWAAGKQTTTRFIASRVTDNPFLNPEYQDTLAALGGWQREAWLEGNWNLSGGQFFSSFRTDLHTVTAVPAMNELRLVAGFDYGFTHWSVFLLGGYDAQDRLWLLDEVVARQTLPETFSRSIRACCLRFGIGPDSLRIFAGPDLNRPDATGETVRRRYARCGINFQPSLTSRVDGWAAILGRLGSPQNGVPVRLLIHRRCAHLLSRLPQLRTDPNCPEDVLKADADEEGNGGDDSPDALRYLVGGITQSVTLRRAF